MTSTRAGRIAALAALTLVGCGRSERAVVFDAQTVDANTAEDAPAARDGADPRRLRITPVTSTLVPGEKRQLNASFGTTDVTSLAAWSSSDNAVISVDSSGEIRALALGSASIKATFKSVTGSASVVVQDTIKAVEVAPTKLTISVGAAQQLTATAILASGSSTDVTGQASWSSSHPSVASVKLGGVVGLSPGYAMIIASLNARGQHLKGSTLLTVTPPPPVTIGVSPATVTIPTGGTAQFKAYGCAPVTWSSSHTAVASVDGTGLAAGWSAGVTTISASCKGASAKATLTVVGGPLCKTLTITPSSPQAVGLGDVITFSATCGSATGVTFNASNLVAWNTSPAGVVSFSGSQAKCIKKGATQVSATYTNPPGASPAATTSQAVLVTCFTFDPVKIVVSPASATVKNGQTQQFTATIVWSTGAASDGTAQVSWQSSSVAVATISATAGSEGLATCVSVGSTTISATLSLFGGQPLSDAASLIVVP